MVLSSLSFTSLLPSSSPSQCPSPSSVANNRCTPSAPRPPPCCRPLRIEMAGSVGNGQPGNTATTVLDENDLLASKISHYRAVRKARDWCRANSQICDLSPYLGPGAEMFTTPFIGNNFIWKFLYKGRELDLLFDGPSLYVKGEGDEHGKFVIHPPGSTKPLYIQEPRCKVIRMHENYTHLCPQGDVGRCRIGPYVMMEAFEVIHKCDGTVTDGLNRSLAQFSCFTAEPVRLEDVLIEILDSFEDFKLSTLDSRSALSFWVRNYGHYSHEYLQIVDHLLRGCPVPDIINREGRTVCSLSELWSRIKVPLRSSYRFGLFGQNQDSHSQPQVWAPPYPDTNGWTLEDEEEEETQSIDEEEEEEDVKPNRHDLNFTDLGGFPYTGFRCFPSAASSSDATAASNVFTRCLCRPLAAASPASVLLPAMSRPLAAASPASVLLPAMSLLKGGELQNRLFCRPHNLSECRKEVATAALRVLNLFRRKL